MADLLLIVRIAGQRVALPASEVEALVELEGITPVPGAAAHVAGLSALRSRVLTAIDCRRALGFAPAGDGAALEAAMVQSGGHAYALLIDDVEDVVESPVPPAPLAASLGAGWEHVSLGMVMAGEELLLLVDPHRIIAGPAAEAA